MEKTRVEILLDALENNETIDNWECRSRLEEHLIACINRAGIEGLGAPRCRLEELLQVLAVTLKDGGILGESGEISCACQSIEAFDVALSQETMTNGVHQVVQEMIDDGIKVYRYKLSVTDTGLISEKILVNSGEEMPCVVSGYYCVIGMTQEEYTALMSVSGMFTYYMLVAGIPQTWSCVFPENFIYKTYSISLGGTEEIVFNVSGAGKYVDNVDDIPLSIDISPRVEFKRST